MLRHRRGALAGGGSGAGGQAVARRARSSSRRASRRAGFGRGDGGRCGERRHCLGARPSWTAARELRRRRRHLRHAVRIAGFGGGRLAGHSAAGRFPGAAWTFASFSLALASFSAASRSTDAPHAPWRRARRLPCRRLPRAPSGRPWRRRSNRSAAPPARLVGGGNARSYCWPGLHRRQRAARLDLAVGAGTQLGAAAAAPPPNQPQPASSAKLDTPSKPSQLLPILSCRLRIPPILARNPAVDAVYPTPRVKLTRLLSQPT